MSPAPARRSGVKALGEWLRSDFRNRIFAGILVVVPLGATFFVLRVILRWVDQFASPFLRRFFQIDFPGMGILLTLIVIYAAGLFAANVLGKRLIAWLEHSFLGRVPLVRHLYPNLKLILASLSRPPSVSFKRVVLIEYPRPRVKTIGFVTGETQEGERSERLLHVFIPTVPNPTSGFLQLVPASEVESTDLTIEEGIRLVVSGGLLEAERVAPTV